MWSTRSVPVNIEADSINAALLAPDAAGGGAAFDAFVREVVREMTVKAGQKCTAIRRIFVPEEKAGDIAEALFAKLKNTKVGDPRNEDTRMGPLVTRAQQQAAFDGIRKLASEAEFVIGDDQPPALDGIDAEKAAFVAPTLLRVKDSRDADAVHEVEVFGPAATIVPYSDEKDACAQVGRGGGSLVASIYGEDKDFLTRMVAGIGASHGRLLVIDPAIAQCAYRARHRHAPVQSRRSRPRRRRRGARRPLWAALLPPAPGGAGLDRVARKPAGAGRGAALIGGMTKYIALLRAINVGGTGKLPMADLKAMCEDAGFAHGADLHRQRQCRVREQGVGSQGEGRARGTPAGLCRQTDRRGGALRRRNGRRREG